MTCWRLKLKNFNKFIIEGVDKLSPPEPGYTVAMFLDDTLGGVQDSLGIYDDEESGPLDDHDDINRRCHREMFYALETMYDIDADTRERIAEFIVYANLSREEQETSLNLFVKKHTILGNMSPDTTRVFGDIVDVMAEATEISVGNFSSGVDCLVWQAVDGKDSEAIDDEAWVGMYVDVGKGYLHNMYPDIELDVCAKLVRDLVFDIGIDARSSLDKFVKSRIKTYMKKPKVFDDIVTNMAEKRDFSFKKFMLIEGKFDDIFGDVLEDI